MSEVFLEQNNVLVKYNGTDSEVIIPQHIKIIGKYAFAGRTTLTSVIIPSSVVKIGRNAFSGCTGLSSIVIPGSVCKIGSEAFSGCTELALVKILDGVQIIGHSTFLNCTNLISILLPDSILSIGPFAFSGCSRINSIHIPNSVSKIGKGAFSNCICLTSVNLSENIDIITEELFYCCNSLKKITIPNSVKEIENNAFKSCSGLSSVKIIGKVKSIGDWAFSFCTRLVSFDVPYGINRITYGAFFGCSALSSVNIPKTVTTIDWHAFEGCRSLTSVLIPGNVKRIEGNAFLGCTNLQSLIIEYGVQYIGDHAFSHCESLNSITIPDSVFLISEYAFADCYELTSITLPSKKIEIGYHAFHLSAYYNDDTNWDNGALYIGRHLVEGKETLYNDYTIKPDTLSIATMAFSSCKNLQLIIVPNSIIEIGFRCFGRLLPHGFMVVCGEDSFAHKYCQKHGYPYCFDYQYESFHGVIPSKVERLASPFLADEESPFVFVSYSHKDRDRVLLVIKNLYESGWKIWYDEGLTIGDSYDDTIEMHVSNCSAFLLFVTANSINSNYIRINELPWAQKYGKPIIKCILDEGYDYDIKGTVAQSSVSQDKIESILETVHGLIKGNHRIAKGIIINYNPNAKELINNRFAYSLYSQRSTALARTIIKEAISNGCEIYDAIKLGEDEKKLHSCASLLVFIDKEFLSNSHLMMILKTEFINGTDLTICSTEAIAFSDLPIELNGIDDLHWLRFDYGITPDNNIRLANHLLEKGCKKTLALPGFDYEKTETGIVITKYTSTISSVRILNKYDELPVVKIDDNAFYNCYHLKEVIIPNSIKSIGNGSFYKCINLISVTMEEGVEEIGKDAFYGCSQLTSVSIPNSIDNIEDGAFQGCSKLKGQDGFLIHKGVVHLYNGTQPIVSIPTNVTKIAGYAFRNCNTLASVIITENVVEIGSGAFIGCDSLTSVVIPESVKRIKDSAFSGCSQLESVIIPDTIPAIEFDTFYDCQRLTSIIIPESIQEIEDSAFENCKNLKSVYIPQNVSFISDNVFKGCDNLTICGIKGSVAHRYAADYSIPFVEK